MGLVTDLFLPLALAFIMFSLGSGLTLNDFSQIIKKPKDFLIGFISQIVILPIVGLILVSIWPLSPELAIGVMLIAVAPGGATSNIITSFAKGDVALSISLTAVISLLCVITIPFTLLTSISFAIGSSVNFEFSIFDIALQMFLIVTIPVIIGMIFKKFFNNLAISFEQTSKKISAILFSLVLLGAIISERENILSYFYQAGLITLLLNLIMMFIAYYLGDVRIIDNI